MGTEKVVFCFYWRGAFRPTHIKRGGVLSFDTGKIATPAGWHRSLIGILFDGTTLFMNRTSETFNQNGLLEANGRWSCVPDQDTTNLRTINGSAIYTPEWVEDYACVCRQGETCSEKHQAFA